METEIDRITTLPGSVKHEIVSTGDHALMGALVWIEMHQGEDSITMGDHIKPFVAAAEKGNDTALAVLLLLSKYHHQRWLHDRMTFHALADVQEWAKARGVKK